jgi:anti-anti-sigma factor
VRIARDIASMEAVAAGDHACWLSDNARDFAVHARSFVADGALFGDKVLLLGPAEVAGARADVVVLDPGNVRGSLLGAVARQADEAGAQGFRALRVLARMDQVWPIGASAGTIAEHELGLDALATATGSLVVCSYPREHFTDESLAQALGVHPHHGGTRMSMEPGFRMYQGRTEHWHVSGVVDAEGADAFRTALTAAVGRGPGELRLHCEELEFMDASGMRALVQAARAADGPGVRLLGVNETVLRCWELLGYGHPDIPVELER